MTPEFIYHYTSAEVLKLMLDGMKRDKTPFLTFWASNIHYMNDPHEMEFLYDELIKVLPDVEKELGITAFPFSKFAFPEDNKLGIHIDLESDIKDNIYNGIYKSVHAISFSKKADYLPMWSLYGNNGNGIVLIFCYKDLDNHFNKDSKGGIGTKLFEMKYDIRESFIWGRIKRFYLRYKLECSLNPQNVNPFQKRREFISRVLLELSPLMKHQTYFYEEEVRLFDQFIYPGDADDIIAKAEFTKLGGKLKEEDLPDVRIKNGLMIPYKEIKVPIDSLKGVIIGPTSNPKLQSQALEVLFRKNGLDIEIKTSSIPFRLM